LTQTSFIKTAEAVKYNGWNFVRCICISIYDPKRLCLRRDRTTLSKFTATCSEITHSSCLSGEPENTEKDGFGRAIASKHRKRWLR
jgi:hypothetical protein